MQLPLLSKTRRRAPWVIGLVAVGVLGTAGSLYLAMRNQSTQPDLTAQTIVVGTQDLTFQLKANGVVQAVRKTNLSPKESGQIIQLYVDEGARVRQGDIIARMDSEQVQAQVNQYQAALARAEADLIQKQTGNRPEEIAKAEAELRKQAALVVQARSRLELASQRLRRKQAAAAEGAISRDSLDESLTEERNARDNLAQAQASLNVARQELSLQNQGYRREEVAQAQAQVAQARAQVQFYQSQLANTIVRAPFDGIITRRFAQAGDFVTPTTSASTSDGATSTSIAELSSGLEVEAKVPEASIGRIRPGQQVQIRSDAFADQTFTGKVRLIAPRAVQENNVTSFRVKVALQDGLAQLKSGMNVKLTFLGDKIARATVVPLAAIVTKKDGQTGVLIADAKNQAQFRPVTVGSTSGSQIQVVEGITPGERIFISPPPGQKVEGVDTVVGF